MRINPLSGAFFHNLQGVDVEIIAPYSCYEIATPSLPQKKISGNRFICKVSGGEPKINSAEHTEWKWQPRSNLDTIDFLLYSQNSHLPGCQASIRNKLFTCFNPYPEVEFPLLLGWWNW